MLHTDIPFWKGAPFARLLLPFIAGVIAQYYLVFDLSFLLLGLSCYTFATLAFYFFSVQAKYRSYKLQGILIQIVIVFIAMLLTFRNDVRNQNGWYGNYYTKTSRLIVRLSEPLSVSAKSLKADASVEAVVLDDTAFQTHGRINLYFSPDLLPAGISYGTSFLINASLQPIKNSGNPGAFDYERYSRLQGIFHTAFLKREDYEIISEDGHPGLDRYIFQTRDFVVAALQKSLPPDKQISGLAEALLIGYKADLDKDLLQAYSNTGVVHIIAISGLHLGLIYGMLTWIFNALPYIRKSKNLKVVAILLFLWAFSLVTGASASVLRSAVMFTCIVIGKNYYHSGSIYNSLATSAFLLLCYNPFYLWDVGFQLSYAAIYGIVWLQKPIYTVVYVKNKYLRKVWQMASVTIAAQITTFPVCIYYFHQFPNMFLVTNLTAVPLSTLILFVEIVVVAFSWWPQAAALAGKCCYGLIWLMNKIIIICNQWHYARVDSIYATLYSTTLLYMMLLSGFAWLLYRKKFFKTLAIAGSVGFIAQYIINRLEHEDQAKIVVYNIPHKKAIDFIQANKYFFSGDSLLLETGSLTNYILKPSRRSLQVSEAVDSISGLHVRGRYIEFYHKTIMIIDTTISFYSVTSPPKIDILIITSNPKLDIENISKAISPGITVFDASNSLWKIAIWKKQCEQLLLPGFSVPEKGAFIFDI